MAIKLVRADLLEGDDREEFLPRFRHEARAAGGCTHQNIVAIYDFAMHEGNPFLAMEFIEGAPLGQALKDVGRFAPKDAAVIAIQVLDALDAAHARGIVHRDIKPANILLPPSGQVKVTDFGISRANTSDLTQDGAVIGSPAYMSPEQCRGETVDARSDLFSVGSVLYELLTGARAFAGRNATEVAYQLMTVDPPDVTEVVPGVPRALADVPRKAMAKDREARYPPRARWRTHCAPRSATMPRRRMRFRRTRQWCSHAAVPVASGLDDAALNAIEQSLARFVGPIARHLVRDAARRTGSADALIEAVSQHIPQVAERERFLAEALDPTRSRVRQTSTWNHAENTGTRSSQVNTGARSRASDPQARPTGPAGVAAASGPPPSGSGVSGEQVERAERALTQVLGPIAKLLVRRALPDCASDATLWERLAAHIERPGDRAAFLRQRPGG